MRNRSVKEGRGVWREVVVGEGDVGGQRKMKQTEVLRKKVARRKLPRKLAARVSRGYGITSDRSIGKQSYLLKLLIKV